MCILNHTQNTFFCLGKFVKKLAGDQRQRSSTTKGSIYHITNMCTYDLYHSSGLTRNQTFSGSVNFIFADTAFLLSTGLVRQSFAFFFFCLPKRKQFQAYSVYSKSAFCFTQTVAFNRWKEMLEKCVQVWGWGCFVIYELVYYVSMLHSVCRSCVCVERCVYTVPLRLVSVRKVSRTLMSYICADTRSEGPGVHVTQLTYHSI